jgi:outer membrane protein assembly factor BamE (lipoprotein component of BamABCDE complex)
MKTSLLTAALLMATLAPLSAAPVASQIPPDRVNELNDDVIILLSHPRISTGSDRDQVIEQLGQPAAKMGTDVWAFTQFRARNVNYAEHYDTLLVVFKDDKVARITLSTAKDVRIAMGRSNAAANAIKAAAGQ